MHYFRKNDRFEEIPVVYPFPPPLKFKTTHTIALVRYNGEEDAFLVTCIRNSSPRPKLFSNLLCSLYSRLSIKTEEDKGTEFITAASDLVSCFFVFTDY